MTNHQYKRPPITEAVIEIRLQDSLPTKEVDKIHTKLNKNYEFSDKISGIEILFDANRKDFQKKSGEFEGYKLMSKDRTDVAQIKTNAMVCSRLAPYTGWDKFEPRARRDWEVLRKTTKHLKVNRIGVRYINRIDIPYRVAEQIDIEDYLTVCPKYPEPELLKNIANYTMQIIGPYSTEGFKLIINTNVVRSPLIEHVSIILDLDLSPTGEIPQRNDEIWEMINQMREHKNNAFEMCITDKARELFSQ